jgi:hypothetical protein
LAAEKGGMETSSNRWYDDDDSDFYSSDDSSDENFCDEENVCNTMLLSGPVGCGKTSAVYACAEELGFKVTLLSQTKLKYRYSTICIHVLVLTVISRRVAYNWDQLKYATPISYFSKELFCS